MHARRELARRFNAISDGLGNAKQRKPVLVTDRKITQQQHGQVNEGNHRFGAKDAGQPAPAQLQDPFKMEIMIPAVVIGMRGRMVRPGFLVAGGCGCHGFEGGSGGFSGHAQQGFLLVYNGGSGEGNQEQKAGEEDVFCVHNQRIMTQTCPR